MNQDCSVFFGTRSPFSLVSHENFPKFLVLEVWNSRITFAPRALLLKQDGVCTVVTS